MLDVAEVEQRVALSEVLVGHKLQDEAGRLGLGTPNQLDDLNDVVMLQ